VKKSSTIENPPMVRMEQVSVVRSDRDGRETKLLDGISFVARRGEISTFVGPSGGGKSTLIRLINRLEEATSGSIFLDGEDMARIDPLLLRRKIGMVLQKPFMFEGSVLQNLQRPFHYRQEQPPVADSEVIRRALELAHLTHELLERDARTLSGGEQQRVSLARAVICAPQVLLLDEPTSSLDRPTADRLAATLHDICRTLQLTVVLVTHDLRLAERITDQLLYLEKGQVLEHGRREDLLSHPQSAEFRRFLAEPEEEGR